MKKRKRFIILSGIMLAFFAAGLTCGGSAQAQTLSNFQGRMQTCMLNHSANSAPLVPYGSPDSAWWLWQPPPAPWRHFAGGGNVSYVHNQTVFIYGWGYTVNGTGTLGSSAYMYGSSYTQSDVNALSYCDLIADDTN
jgi:hypothetical protein